MMKLKPTLDMKDRQRPYEAPLDSIRPHRVTWIQRAYLRR
jgi:hypothetical protein